MVAVCDGCLFLTSLKILFLGQVEHCEPVSKLGFKKRGKCMVGAIPVLSFLLLIWGAFVPSFQFTIHGVAGEKFIFGSLSYLYPTVYYVLTLFTDTFHCFTDTFPPLFRHRAKFWTCEFFGGGLLVVQCGHTIVAAEQPQYHDDFFCGHSVHCCVVHYLFLHCARLPENCFVGHVERANAVAASEKTVLLDGSLEFVVGH